MSNLTSYIIAVVRARSARGFQWMLIAVCTLLAGFMTHAGLAPHEVLVLVNKNSPRSMEVANHFVRIRQIPPRNVVYLDLPGRVLAPRAEMSPSDFTRHIWEPAQAVLAERELSGHILAWIYSVDFPVRITGDPNLSLMGPTFLRNEWPADRDLAYRGQYGSPLYTGPDEPDGPMRPGGSLIRYKEALGERMPIPSMMLGFCGARGTDTDTVIRTLQYGQLSDRTTPRGTVYWLTHDDIRTRIREWQFPIARGELEAKPVRSVIKAGPAEQFSDIIGLQTGVENVDAARAGRHLPGSMAEHLTSHAAEFHLPIQTKLTDWIRAGATASAGTVTEPYAIWTKFPHARFFSHYANGHTMLESFYMSLRSPLQTLLVGEPLARPWAPPLSLTLIALEEGPFSGEASFVAALMPGAPPGRVEYQLLLNGMKAGRSGDGGSFSFDTRQLPDGWHELRAVAYIRGPVVHATTGRMDLEIRNHGRGVRITRPERGAEIDLHTVFPMEVEWEGDPETVQLIHNERVLMELDAPTSVFELDPASIGAGPVALQAQANYADGMAVRSAPLELEVARGTPPSVRALQAKDKEGVLTSPKWEDAIVSGGKITRPEGAVVLTPGNDSAFTSVVMPGAMGKPNGSISARLTIPAGWAEHPNEERAGLLFNVRDEANFDFFLLHGTPSAWSFGRCRDGQFHYALNRGALILRNTPHQIDLVFEGPAVTAFVNQERVSTWTHSGTAESQGGVGILSAGRPARFEEVKWE